MHASTTIGASMDSKRFRKTSDSLQDTSNKHRGFRLDAPLAKSATLRFAQGTMIVKSHLKHDLHDIYFKASIDLVCKYMVVVMGRTVARHPTQKNVLRSESILNRWPGLLASVNNFSQNNIS